MHAHGANTSCNHMTATVSIYVTGQCLLTAKLELNNSQRGNEH